MIRLPSRSEINWWALYHGMLTAELRSWTPESIGRLTPTQLRAMSEDRQRDPDTIETAEAYEAMLAAREAERAHWENRSVPPGSTVRGNRER